LKKRSLWFSSVLEEAAESGRYLSAPLIHQDPPSSEPLMSDNISGDCTEEQKEWWASHNTTSIADLREFNLPLGVAPLPKILITDVSSGENILIHCMLR